MKLIHYKKGQFPSQPDPFILEGRDGKFYIYVTANGNDSVHAYCADSLTGDYNDIGVVFDSPGKRDYWAPSVTLIGDTYYMYVSCIDREPIDPQKNIQTMHVAHSDSPAGPFVDARPIIPPFSIDSHVVETPAGLFMLYAANDTEAERIGTRIYVDRMIDPYTVCGNPVPLVEPTLDEEIYRRDRYEPGRHWHTIEGPCYFFADGYHYIIYSGSAYQNESYFLGYAVAKTEEQDLTKIKFKKYPDDNTYAPLIAKNEFEEGTGHNSVICHEGQWYVVYHGRDYKPDPRMADEFRTARICRLEVDAGRLVAHRYENKL